MKLNKIFNGTLIVGAFAFGAQVSWADWSDYSAANTQLTKDYKRIEDDGAGNVSGATQVEDRAWNKLKEEVCGTTDVHPSTDEDILECFTRFTNAQDQVLKATIHEAGID